jgi:lipoprotein NlpI
MPAASAASTSNHAGGPSAGGRAKVFISYSRKDAAFAQGLVQHLTAAGFDAFLDKTDIAPGEPWKERLAGLIGAADTVLFVVSPDSVASEICAWELEESGRLSKRIIPVVARRIADADAPAVLGRLNFVFCAEGDDREAALARLGEALRTDLPWVREHSRLGELARRWHERGRTNAAALRGADLEAAERWLDRRPADANAPTELHQDYIRASRRAATARQRLWVAGASLVALLALALAGFAELNRREAQAQRDRAERTLTLATLTTNRLVSDLSREFRDLVGVPTPMIKDILDRVRELQDQLVSAGESSPELRRSRAEALIETAPTLLALGDTGGALAAAQQARDILQALLLQKPDSLDLERELSVAFERSGSVLTVQGHLPEALKSYEAGLVIAERLARSDAGNALWQHDLSALYERVGDTEAAQGHLPEALKSYSASSAILERLAQLDPGDPGRQHDLSVSEEKLADVLFAQDDLEAALRTYSASLAARQGAASGVPGNAAWQHDLSVSYIKLGDVQLAQGRLAEALSAYRAGSAIAERLANADPSNTDWQRDLSVADQRLGDLLFSQGDLPEALKSYEATLAIGARLAKSDAGNASWQRDLSVSYEKVGEVELAQGDVMQALASYEASLAIRERLATSDPGNAQWQRDLARIQRQLAHAKIYADRPAAAADDLVAALKVQPADAYAVIWLYIARLRNGQDGKAELALNAGGIDRSRWPWPVVALFLGRETPEALRRAASLADSPKQRDGRACEADFYLAIHDLEIGESAGARTLLESAAQRCPPTFAEATAARLELQRRR